MRLLSLATASLFLAGPALATDPMPANAVLNSFFDDDVSAWSVDPAQGPIQPYNEVSLVFDASRDLADDVDSGSLQVQSRMPDLDHPSGAAVQCVPVTEYDTYRLSGAILIPPGTPITVSFTASLQVRYFDTASCESPLGAWTLAGSRSSETSTPDHWYASWSSWLPVPPGAESAQVRAEIETTPDSQWGQTVSANFDSITFAPEPSLALGELSALLVLAAARRSRSPRA